LTSRAASSFLVVAILVVACGARSELIIPIEEPDAEAGMDATSADATVEAMEDGEADAPEEPDALDAPEEECNDETYCNVDDPSHIYKCGRTVEACGPLEQCEEREGGALCVNPCVDTLGNDTSNGCDFYAVEMDTTQEVTGVCYAVFVVNQWKTGTAAKLEVTRAGQVLPIQEFARIPVGTGTGITYESFDAQKGLPANEIAILFLSRDPNHAGDPHPSPNDPALLANCPQGVTPAVVGDAATHGTGLGNAFHIQSNVPVVAYQMLPYGGGRARVTGSTLLLPTSAWDTNYVVADAYDTPSPSLLPEPRSGPTTVIVASQNGTHVTIKPTTTILPTPEVAGTPLNVPAHYTLNQGQYLQFTQSIPLTGSALQADRPVAVIGGATLMDVPITSLRADTAEQMIPPVRALGSEYVAARYRNRVPGIEEVVPWRIVGAVDGTVLTYDPPQPGAPAAIGARQMVEYNAPGPFVVSSQDANHPFYLASYMTGGCGAPAKFDDAGVPSCPEVDGGPDGPGLGFGDPEFLNVVPPAQYLPHYTFFTDPTYPETNLVIVRMRDPQTMAMPQVTLDCAGVLRGWQAVGTTGKYEMTRVDLSTGDFRGVGKCNNGVHTISGELVGATGSPPPTPFFGVTVWGWGNNATWPTDNPGVDETNPLFTRWVSYGYPAGANFKPLNTAVVPAQ
jgi:hypothetical protein